MNIFSDTAPLPPHYRKNVGIILLNKDNHIFLGRRVHFSTQASNHKYQDDANYGWQMPQGGVDEGEDTQSAMWRELEEEVGTRKAEILKISSYWYAYDFPKTFNNAPFQKKVWDGQYQGQIQKWFLMRFVGQDADIQLNTAHPEFSDFVWATPDTVMQRVIPFKCDVYRAVLDEFTLDN